MRTEFAVLLLGKGEIANHFGEKGHTECLDAGLLVVRPEFLEGQGQRLTRRLERLPIGASLVVALSHSPAKL